MTLQPSVSFAADVVPLFSAPDIACMTGFQVFLDNFDYMSAPVGDFKFPDHANARHVYARLKGTEVPRMPKGGPFWPDSKLNLFKSWMDGGFLP